MILGFTGTREGVTNDIYFKMYDAIATLKCIGLKEIHHGQCVGADRVIHKIACDLGIPVVVHPPKKKDFVFDLKHKDFKKNKVIVLQEFDYLKEIGIL